MINETMKTILTRRSIRSYLPDEVPQDAIEEILKAGQYAATGLGIQPWHFTVITNKDFLNRISEEVRMLMAASKIPMMEERAKMPGFHTFYNAPVVIIVSGDKKADYSATDCANATENMALAAHSLGIGSCYISSFKLAMMGRRGAAFKKEMGIPEDYETYYALALGYAAGNAPEPAPRREGVVNYMK